MNICVIPARGGSKRIPRKNIKEFCGKPIIAYSIEAAVESGLFDHVIVSTDDKGIARIANELGAETPFLRPPNLSDDHTGTADVTAHAVNFIETSEQSPCHFVCTLHATAPFVQVSHLVKGYEALMKSDAVMAFASSPINFPIQRAFRINQFGRCEMFTPQHYGTRSQDLEVAYQDAGQFYWTNRSMELISPVKVVFSDKSIPIIIPSYMVQDIDTVEDWVRAELMFEAFMKMFGKERNGSIKISKLNG